MDFCCLCENTVVVLSVLLACDAALLCCAMFCAMLCCAMYAVLCRAMFYACVLLCVSLLLRTLVATLRFLLVVKKGTGRNKGGCYVCRQSGSCLFFEEGNLPSRPPKKRLTQDISSTIILKCPDPTSHAPQPVSFLGGGGGPRCPEVCPSDLPGIQKAHFRTQRHVGQHRHWRYRRRCRGWTCRGTAYYMQGLWCFIRNPAVLFPSPGERHQRNN